MAKQHVGIRLELGTVEELAELAAAMSERAAGAPVTSSDAARLAIERGIAVLRKELGLPLKGGKAPRKAK